MVDSLIAEFTELLLAGVCAVYPRASRLGRTGPTLSRIQVRVWKSQAEYLEYAQAQEAYAKFLSLVWAEIAADRELFRRLISLQTQIRSRVPIWVGLGVQCMPHEFSEQDKLWLKENGFGEN